VAATRAVGGSLVDVVRGLSVGLSRSFVSQSLVGLPLHDMGAGHCKGFRRSADPSSQKSRSATGAYSRAGNRAPGGGGEGRGAEVQRERVRSRVRFAVHP